MTRPYHSPSSLSTGALCDAMWAFGYLDHLRDPEVDYADIEAGRIKPTFVPQGPGQCSYKQRGGALGAALHHVWEAYFTGGQPAWNTYAGQVAMAGIELLPHPDLCEWVSVEAPVGAEIIGYRKRGEGGEIKAEPAEGLDPVYVLRVEGVAFNGFRDLTVKIKPDELERLGLSHAPGGIVLYDYKSTSNIALYALSADDLRKDVQCNLYALDVMIKYGLESVACRWVYFETKDVRQAVAIDVVITREHARSIIHAQIELAHHLDTIQSSATAALNWRSCFKYGGKRGEIGCSYHSSKGGPCRMKHTSGQLMMAPFGRKEEGKMPLSDAHKARFVAKKQEASPPADDAQPESVENGDVAPSAPAETSAPAVTETPRPRTRTMKAPAQTGLAASLAEFAQAVAEQDAIIAGAEAEKAKIKAAVAKAVA